MYRICSICEVCTESALFVNYVQNQPAFWIMYRIRSLWSMYRICCLCEVCTESALFVNYVQNRPSLWSMYGIRSAFVKNVQNLLSVWSMYIICSLCEVCKEFAAFVKYAQNLLSELSMYRISSLFMPPKELWEAYSNRTVRTSVRLSRFRVRSISTIFFEVGIPNLVWMHLGKA